MINVQTTKEQIESQGGLILIGKLAELMGIPNVTSWENKPTGAILTQIFGMITLAQTTFEASRKFRGNDFISEALALQMVYAPETLRIYLEPMCDTHESVDNLIRQLNECTNRLLEKAKLTPVKTKRNLYIPLDFDTSPFNNEKTQKEGIGYTYKKFFGFQPMFGYIGLEGYMLRCELRPGDQHCQKGTPQFINSVVQSLPSSVTGKKILLRFDSGNDSIDTVKSIFDSFDNINNNRGKSSKTKPFILIKRNIRNEDPQWWLETAKEEGVSNSPRKGKERYVGKIKLDCPICNTYSDVDVVFEVIERSIDSDGTPLLLPKIEVNTFWSNLNEDDETVIDLYHAHGTMEQFHSELKSDMGVERLPSGKYGVNQVILTLAMCAFNALRFIGQTVIDKKELMPVVPRKETKRKRLGTVIRDIIHIAGKYVTHAGKTVFKIYEYNPWLPSFQYLYSYFRTI
jgi:hypothetical protein